MATATVYRVNRPHVIDETVDGEVIIVDLSSGRYYSLTGTGAEMWAGLATGVAPDQLVDALQRRYRASRAELSEAVDGLLRDLERDRLLVPAENGAGTLDGAGARLPEDRPARVAAPDAQAAFVPPRLESFDDMQDLMLLDPIHEVDTEEGWPHRPGASEPTR